MGYKEFHSSAEREVMKDRNKVPQSCALLLLSDVASSAKPLEENQSPLSPMKENDLEENERC